MKWKEFIENEKNEIYFQEILEKVSKERKDKIIYPPEDKVFRVFELCDFDDIKVVILGMDPYINYKQANGLCFAVEQEYPMPPSLKNIFKVSQVIEEEQDRTLLKWLTQGVFLLNTILTVEAGSSGSHNKIGWQKFTHKIIKKISDEKENVVFMLWGRIAQQLENYIDSDKHLVLKSTHPSPFSCRRIGTAAGDSFMTCDHFNKCNNYLKRYNKEHISW